MISRLAAVVLILVAWAGCGDGGAASTGAAPAKDSQSLAGIQVPDSWGSASAGGGGTSELVRYREKLDGIAGHPGLARRLIVTRRYHQFPPSPSEAQEVDVVEDEFCSVLERGNEAVLALVRTGRGARRWVFYCSQSEELVSRLTPLRGRAIALGLVLNEGDDPGWAMYREFMPK